MKGNPPSGADDFFKIIDELNREGLHNSAKQVMDLAMNLNPSWENTSEEFIARKYMESQNYRKALDMARRWARGEVNTEQLKAAADAAADAADADAAAAAAAAADAAYAAAAAAYAAYAAAAAAANAAAAADDAAYADAVAADAAYAAYAAYAVRAEMLKKCAALVRGHITADIVITALEKTGI